MQRTAICIMGPTASGKTDLAVELAQRFALQIVSVDSAMVYRGMDIGTGKPNSSILSHAPHALIDVEDPWVAYSAARFMVDACAEMHRIADLGYTPLLVGGTGLYFRALLGGLSQLPAADPEIRARLEFQASKHGWAWMHTRLHEVDPTAAARIDVGDPQRIQRALEVYALTGQPLSRLQGHRQPPLSGWRFIKLALFPDDRGWLHSRIAERFSQMLDLGLIDEVQQLLGYSGMHSELPSMRAVGYRQVAAYLRGQMSYHAMVERAVIATRQLARRQLTWLRSEPEITRLDPKLADTPAHLKLSVEKALGSANE